MLSREDRDDRFRLVELPLGEQGDERRVVVVGELLPQRLDGALEGVLGGLGVVGAPLSAVGSGSHHLDHAPEGDGLTPRAPISEAGTFPDSPCAPRPGGLTSSDVLRGVRTRPEPASTLPIGPRLVAALDVARAAGLPVLLSGRSGIGKSEFVAAYAASRQLDACVLDLSLLEAADLTGLPYLRDGLTHFAPPAALPRQDGGRSSVLVLEELNRCDRSIRQPCLQLLTARRLNDYRLPEGCWMVACINPAEDHHDAEELDAALASRFVRLSVHADRSAWLGWARERGVHPGVVGVVDRYAQALDAAPPRSWTQAARLVSAHSSSAAPPEALDPLVRAVLPPVAATTLLDTLARGAGHEVVAAEDMVSLPTFHAGRLRVLAKEGRLDQIVEALRRLEEVAAISPVAALEELLAAVPPDLHETWGPRILGVARR